MFYERREDILAKIASRLSIIGLDYQVNNAVQHNKRSQPMATRIDAWKARDGSVHETEEAAKRSDLRAALRSITVLDDSGHSVIEGIINNSETVHAALTEYLVRFQKRVP